MDSVSVTDKVLESKLDRYGGNNDNFTAPQELTVTITLNEYRDLVSKVATRQAAIDEANKDKYERNNLNEKLEKEIADLKAELYEYHKKAEEKPEEAGEVTE